MRRTIWFAVGTAGVLTALVVALVLFGVVGGSTARLLPAIQLSSTGDLAGTANGREDAADDRGDTAGGADSAQNGREAADATVTPTTAISGNQAGNAGDGISGSRGRETITGPLRYQGGGPGSGTQEVGEQGSAQGGPK